MFRVWKKIRTGHGKIGWFQSRKRVQKSYTLLPCLFNIYLEYTIQNSGLDESQAGIKIARRNINNLIHAADTTLMGESKEEGERRE